MKIKLIFTLIILSFSINNYSQSFINYREIVFQDFQQEYKNQKIIFLDLNPDVLFPLLGTFKNRVFI